MQRRLPEWIVRRDAANIAAASRGGYFDTEAVHSGSDVTEGSSDGDTGSEDSSGTRTTRPYSDDDEESTLHSIGTTSSSSTNSEEDSSDAHSSDEDQENQDPEEASSYETSSPAASDDEDDIDSLISTSHVFHAGISMMGRHDEAEHVCVPSQALCTRPRCVMLRTLEREEEAGRAADAEASRLRAYSRKRQREAGSENEESDDAELSSDGC